MNVLLILTHPEPIRKQYSDHIRANFPGSVVNVVDHHSKAGPYIASADVLMTFDIMIADHVLKGAPRLKWIHALSTGTDGIEQLPSLRSDVVLTSTRGVHGAPMSEAALMAMLALARDFPRSVRNQERRTWARHIPTLLEGKTIGIFGVGVIGATLALKCKALGMTVIGVDPIQRDVAGVDRIVGWNEGLSVIGDLDYVVLLIPASASTRGIVNAEVLSRMKTTAFLVSLGRGEVLDEDALLKILQERRIAGAALDVFRKEPLPDDHPFWSMDNVIITAHLGGASDEYPKRAFPILDHNMRRFLAGDTANMINLIHH